MLRSVLQIALVFAIPLAAVEASKEQTNLITHECGTFTSVAREDGSPAGWAPLSGASDLPCFVTNLGPPRFKERASGLVRMERPVLYFYSPQPTTLSVRVGFPQGWITEWYPRATSVLPSDTGSATVSPFAGGEIRWDRVELLPGETPVLPAGKDSSHYYAARETDSAPLRIGTQWEKLIFYRGIGDFPAPLRPVFTAGRRVKVTSMSPETVPLVILFENRGRKIGYRIARSLRGSIEISMPELTNDLEVLRADLADELVEFGLYRKEALAMIQTWLDSWFEEGMVVLHRSANNG
jgi:hypothetical protein